MKAHLQPRTAGPLRKMQRCGLRGAVASVAGLDSVLVLVIPLPSVVV